MSLFDFDVILRNALVIDGTLGPSYPADVGITADRITKIGCLKRVKATLIIDGLGLVVAPGFIDVHSHDDAAVIARPEMHAKLTQGVTSVIGGNCGIGGAPYTAAANPPNLLRLVFKSKDFVAPSFQDYLGKVRAAQPAINAGFLTGHTTLRMHVMGEDLDRSASQAEILQMQGLLSNSLRAGSFGLSTGLFYPPARAASTEEVIGVAMPLRQLGGVYTSHIRDEADGVMESLKEALQIGESSRCATIISHHKCMGKRNFGRSTQTLELLEQARRHQAVALDVYPYTAGSSVLNEELVSLSSRTVITWCDPFAEFCGKDLIEVEAQLGGSRAEVIRKLQPAGALYFMMDEADVKRIMCAPQAMIASDGLPEDQRPHPRLWGTFPRVLGHYVRECGLQSLEEAVHRMTGLPAQRFGIAGRGTIQEGAYADICMFDPATIRDRATYEQPIQAAAGIHYVFVNGQMALERGVPTAQRAGRVLLRASAGSN